MHVFDWDAYHTVFKQGSKYHRPGDFYNAPQQQGSFLNQCDDHKASKQHRDLFIHSFSKAKIQSLEPLIHEKVAVLLRRLREAAQDSTTIDLEMALQCLTADVTMHYSYQMDFGMLDHSEFRPKFITDLKKVGSIVVLFWYLPALGMLLNKMIFEWLPDSVVRKYFASAISAKDMVKVSRLTIKSVVYQVLSGV